MTFTGLDLHKKEVEAVLLAEDGRILHRSRFPATRAALEAFAAARLSSRDSIVAVEATTNTWPVAAILQPLVHKLVVSNPLRTKAIASAKIKTDKVDALVLAQLLRADYLPEVWIPDGPTRLMRQRSTERAMLSADRTRIKNRIHSVLHQRLIAAPSPDLFSMKNIAWLKALPLDPFGRDSLDRHLRQLDRVEQELLALTSQIAVHAHQTPAVKLLMTLPVWTLPSPKPSSRPWAMFPIQDSRSSRILSRAGPFHPPIRRPLLSRTDHKTRSPSCPLAAGSGRAACGPASRTPRRFLPPHRQKEDRNVAVVAVAHKLVVLAWHMLHNNEPYRYAQPKTLQAKLSRLRILATQQKRKGGNVKGQPRSAQYGKGRTQAIPGLDELYGKEGLPPLSKQCKPGEQAMLDRQNLTAFATAVQTAGARTGAAKKA